MNGLIGRVPVDPAVAQRALEDLAHRPPVSRKQRPQIDAHRLVDGTSPASGLTGGTAASMASRCSPSSFAVSGRPARRNRRAVIEPPRMRVSPDPYHPGQNLVEQLPSGEWVERAQYFEAVAVSGEGVFDTLKAVSKLVLKSLA